MLLKLKSPVLIPKYVVTKSETMVATRCGRGKEYHVTAVPVWATNEHSDPVMTKLYVNQIQWRYG